MATAKGSKPKPKKLTEKDRGIRVEANTNVFTPPPETHGRAEILTAAAALETSGRDLQAEGGEVAVLKVKPESHIKGE